MKKIEQQLEDKKSEVYMLRSERTAIKASILGEAKTAPFFSFFFSSAYRLVPAALAVILIVSVPVAYASQESVPGDFLYSFEINVIEEVEEMFVSKDNRARYHSERLEERLQELQAVVNKADAGALVVPVIEDIREHSEKAVAALEKHSHDDEIEELIEVSALVEASADLIDVAQDQQASDSAVKESADFVSNALVAEIDDYTEEKSSDEISNAIAENLEKINALSKGSDSVTEAYVENRLKDASEKIVEEDWDETLTTLAETRVELRKQDLLK